MRQIAIFLVGCCVAGSASASSMCFDPPVPRPFDTVLHAAKSVAVVRIEAIRARTRPPSREDPDIEWVPPKSNDWVLELEADVRVAETLIGEPAAVSKLQFSANSCGGHHLDAGAYYVMLLESDAQVVVLEPRSEAILQLFDEYVEHVGSTASRSRLLMNLRNFARLGRFPETFDVGKHFAAKPFHPPVP